MTKEELREKRNLAIENLNHAIAILGSDELYIDELEKENAELKEAIKHFNPCGEWNDDVHDCEFSHYAMEYGSKLTKAEEILREYIRINLLPPIERNFYDEVKLFKEAEQFLKEVEK